MADPDKSSRDKLATLHPPRRFDVPLSPSGFLVTPATTDEVRTALESFSSRTAPGAFGLRPEPLVESARADRSGAFLHQLTAVVNLFREGKMPSTIAHLMAGATLTGILKKDGGVRPIAAGETLRRLVGKIQAARHIPPLRSHLEPFQLGVGTPMGAERIARLVESWRRKNLGSSTKVLLKVDLKNAFNSVSRRAVLEAVAKHAPELLPWVWSTPSAGSATVPSS
jgi:hypothetical protein